MKVLDHFKTITQHKLLVMKGCFQLGLYKQGLLHDLSKHTPEEFLTGVKYYQGTRSPNTAEREALGYSSAWLHHKGRNKHHYEYWIDFNVLDSDHILYLAPMPDKYIVEMFVDRVAACKIYNGDNFTCADPLAYYNRGNTGQFLHPYTRKMLVGLLRMYEAKGEKYTFHYIRKKILKNTRK